MQYLRADTNTEVLIGPVVAVGDGFTPVTTLSPSTADEAELIKYGGASALTVTDISASTMTAITGADGYYTLDISTGNTDTEGFLTVLFNDDSLCLPVRHDFMVVNANVYDSLFAAAATDYLQVDVAQVSSDATAADNLEADYDGTGYNKSASTIGTASNVTNLGGTAAATQINNQVLDVINTDASTTPAQQQPPQSASLRTKIDYIYAEYVSQKVIVDNTAGDKEVYADDETTVLYRKGLSDTGSILTVAEPTTGP